MQTFAAPFPLVLVGLFVFVFLWAVPWLQVTCNRGLNDVKADARISLVNATRQAWAQVLTGVFFLVTAYFTWRTVMATEENLEVAKRGQITDRYTKAVDQLGADNANNPAGLSRRIGGIYALERIAFDSPEYHWPVVEVLTAYMRVNAKWTGKRTADDPYSEDMQSILTVLGRRKRDSKYTEQGSLDLNSTDMAGTNLQGAHFENAYLYGAHLEGASLIDAHLEGTILQKAHLEKTDLTHTHFGMGLRETDLTGCFLAGANLKGTDLTQTNITQPQLDSALTDAATKVKSSLHLMPENVH